jgi:undecaprenyl diphosphate synthase
MRLFERYLRNEALNSAKHGIRVSIIGRRDRLSAPLLDAIQAEATTTPGDRMHLRIAVD